MHSKLCLFSEEFDILLTTSPFPHGNKERIKKRKHIKRRRFHMAEQDNVNWYNHCDAYVTLLESVCVGTDRSMGCTFSDNFWWKFTRRLTMECRLRIGVTQATVNLCMQFGELLKSMYKDFEANSRQLSPSRRILVESHPPELRQRLFNIFGQRTPSFPGLSDGRSNRKSSRSRRSSDASIHKPYFDITLKKELEDAITDLVYAKDLDIKDVAQVDSFLSSSEMTAKVFMRGDRNARISLIQDMLKR